MRKPFSGTDYLNTHFIDIVRRLVDDIIFSFDFKSNTVETVGKVLQSVGIPASTNRFPDLILEKGLIVNEDIPRFLSLLDNMRSGICLPAEFRIIRLNGSPEWYRVEYELVLDDGGFPLGAVGRVENIELKKQLEYQASIDSLTKCLNKRATEEMVERVLSGGISEGKHALFVLDIDNFKGINDNLGHHFGDYVLTELVQQLEGILQSGEIVGRIGGDEFLVFIQDMKDIQTVEKKAEEIADVFRKTYKGTNKEIKISGSIGIALYPDDGRTYQELYQKADCALYASKREGKNQYTIYKDTILVVPNSNQKLFDNAKELLSRYFEGELIFRITDFLYETSELEITVNKILEILGKTFSVDRCYIFETEQNGSIFRNTYEWCSRSELEERQSLQNLPASELNYILSQYNSEGVFYSNDISAMDDEMFQLLSRQGIQSILHCASKREGVIQVVIGFDDCTRKRIWTDKEIATLLYVSKILALHLMHHRVNRELKKLYQRRNMMLENMGAFVYAIDVDTKKIIFYNELVRKWVPDVKCGDTCHMAALGCRTPCRVCPADQLTSDRKSVTEEIYNYRFKLVTLATATSVEWEGVKNAALVVCTDITKYKAQAVTEVQKATERNNLLCLKK